MDNRQKDIDLRFFSEHEFEREGKKWLPLCCPRLLVLTDTFRLIWNAPVLISPHPRAIGRYDTGSQHDYTKWGQVRALDVMPSGIKGRNDAERALDIAVKIGFTGIGFYPLWRNKNKTQPGFHFDTRRNANPASPVKWGGIRSGSGQRYTDIQEAMNVM